MPTALNLHDGWTVRPVAGPVPDEVADAGPILATVPGTVHTDLLAAGLIPDPYLDDNERLLAWIGLTDWRYETMFDWAPGDDDRVQLVFEGLDTVAAVLLNGEVLASTANMHRTYRIDVHDLLREGTNLLSVTFDSAVRFADQNSLELGARPHVNHHPFNAIRKMACNFGWDWGPDVVTAGIWRPATLQSWRTARLAAVRPVVDVLGSHGTVEVHVDVERADQAAPLVVVARVGGAAASLSLGPGETTGTVSLSVDDVERWWPRGHGDQPLYDLVVTLGEEGHPDSELDTWSRPIGFRTVRLVTEEDEHGTSFTFVVNDQPVFVKGVNWIPDDAFPHRVSRSRYADRLAQAAEAGVNLVRVWGGGIFEADDFYAECDERGLMVWQDFLFACAAYSEEEPLRSEVIAETRDNVTRLMTHPSLVLWNGCNENIWGHEDWEWKSRLDGKTWGWGYYTDVLPGIVAELDPGRPYSAGSPWSPTAGSPISPTAGSPSASTTDRHPNDPRHGTMHIWDVWNQLDYPVYRDYTPRFAAEFGWQGPPTWSTLIRSVSDDPLTPESPGMLVHQKAAEGHRKLTRGLVAHLPVPDDMDDWHWAMSLNQARAVQAGVEHFRSLSPLCSGSVMWQLNDCWPVTSWAAVDGDGRRKPLFYALQHAHADRLVTVQPRDGGLVAVLVNDTREAWSEPVLVTRRDFDGKELNAVQLAVDAAARATVVLPLPAEVATPGDPRREVLVVQTEAARCLWFFAEDRDSDLPPPSFDASVTRTETGYAVQVAALSLVRDLALLVDKVDPDAIVDDMLTTMLPGETLTWQVTSSADADQDAFLHPTVLRSANQLVHQ
jgi:beta-mannosidase